MKIKYDFADGTSNEVEITEEIGEVICAIEHDTHNNERKEKRRYISLDFWMEEGMQFPDDTDLLAKVLQDDGAGMIHKAVLQLKPQQQELIYALYLTDHPMSHAEYARKLGIAETSVIQKAWRARERLKEVLQQMKK